MRQTAEAAYDIHFRVIAFSHGKIQARPGYTPGQVKQAMTATALDTEAPSYDVNSGYGIAMANSAVSYALSH